MKLVVAGMAGAGGLLMASQLGTSTIDQMIGQEMGMTESMMQTAVKTANTALGTGTDVSFTVLAVAAMPIVFKLVQSGLAMAQQEHELSIAKRKKAAGLDGVKIE
jgi:hypothetical protein